MSDDDAWNGLLFGPGFCKICGLIKPLALVAMPGMHENEETGELEGGVLHLDPFERSGYCRECALEMIANTKQ